VLDGGDGELRAEGLVAEQQAVVDGREQQVEGDLDIEVGPELAGRDALAEEASGEARRGASHWSRIAVAISSCDWASAMSERMSGPAGVRVNRRTAATTSSSSDSAAGAFWGRDHEEAALRMKPSRATAPRDGQYL